MIRRRMRAPARLLMLIVMGTALASSSALAEQKVELLLSWGAPFGQNGAHESAERDCADTTRADTLYLSYRLSEDAAVFSGMTGLLQFHAQLDDTLGAPWRTAEQKPPFLKVEFPADTTDAFRPGWRGTGFGDWRYYSEPAQGIVRMIYAVPSMAAQPILSGRNYCLARIIVRRTPGESCDQSLCVEWMESRISFSVNSGDVSGSQVRSSFVTANSPMGLACAKYRVMAERREAEREAARQKRLQEIKEAAEAAERNRR